jgi:hypothetical protein
VLTNKEKGIKIHKGINAFTPCLQKSFANSKPFGSERLRTSRLTYSCRRPGIFLVGHTYTAPIDTYKSHVINPDNKQVDKSRYSRFTIEIVLKREYKKLKS